jgi:hypothetical protein
LIAVREESMKTQVELFHGYRMTLSGSALGYKIVVTCAGAAILRAEGSSDVELLRFARETIRRHKRWAPCHATSRRRTGKVTAGGMTRRRTGSKR